MKDQEYDYFYDDEQDAKYCYPGTNILKNKLDIRDLDILHEAERDFSSVRQAELSNMGVPVSSDTFKITCSKFSLSLCNTEYRLTFYKVPHYFIRKYACIF